MIRIFLFQYIKSHYRSTRFKTNLIFKILIALALFNICTIFFLFGLNFREILFRILPAVDPVKYFNQCLIYLISIDFVLRFFFQKSNFFSVVSYLHLPIKRSSIISYILSIELFNIFNLLFIILVFPFAWLNILPYGWITFGLYLFNILLILVIQTYLSFLLRSMALKSFIYGLIPVTWILVVFIMKYYFRIEIGEFTEPLFNNILHQNYLILIMLFLAVILLVILDTRIIKQLLYNPFTSNNLKIGSTTTLLLNGQNNLYIHVEICLIFRNKRIRSILSIPLYLIIVTYILFFLIPVTDSYTVFFWYLCLFGIWGYSYLQYVFSFESSFFDFLATTNFNLHEYLKAKYRLIVFFTFLILFIISPILIFKKQSLYIVLTAFFYDISIGFFIVFLTGTFNKARINLKDSMLFNYQGNNTLQLISLAFAILFPLSFLAISTSLLSQQIGLIMLNFLSFISLLLNKRWFLLINRQLLKRKYINMEGFRL